MHVCLLFVDGLGLGERDPDINPLYAAALPHLHHILEEGVVFSADAVLGVAGLPQSATGQTALLTGINAPAAVGRHIHGFPTKTLKKILLEHSLLKELTSRGYRVTNANMYTQSYLDRMLHPEREGHFPVSATTLATLAAGIPFRMESDLLRGEAIFQDITNAALIERGLSAPLRDPWDAGAILAGLTARHDFTMFEYFQTDLAGHSQDLNRCVQVLQTLDGMLAGFLDAADIDRTLLLLTSDHGNIEDLRVRTHTVNPVPAAFYGRNQADPMLAVASLLDIAPVLSAYLDKMRGEHGSG